MASPNNTALAPTSPPPKRAVTAGSRGLVLRDINDMWQFAGAVIKSRIAPKGLNAQEQIMVAIQYGAELGLAPMQAMGTVMVVNGRPSLFGDGMLAVAQASGLLADIKETIEGTADKPETLKAVCEVKRHGRPTPSRGEFSWADAKRAGLTSKDTYKQYPQRMLKARARAFALHDAFPDVLCGVLSTDEAADYPDEASHAFVDGAEQAPTDLETLMLTDATEVADELNDEPDLMEQPEVEWPDAKDGLFPKAENANEA